MKAGAATKIDKWLELLRARSRRYWHLNLRPGVSTSLEAWWTVTVPETNAFDTKTGPGSHSTALRQMGLQQTELRQAGIPLTSATTSASSSVPATTTSKLFLDAQPSATDEPMPATTDLSGGIKRPMEASSEMRTGVGDVGTDVPTNVLCPISEEVEDHEGQERRTGPKARRDVRPGP